MKITTKLTSDLSVDELLSALKTEEVNGESVKKEEHSLTSLPVLKKEDNEYKENYQAASFIDAFKITAGNHFIKGSVLYKLFKLWNKGTKLSSRSFHLQLATILKNVSTGQAAYKINEKPTRLINYIDQYEKELKHKIRHNKDYRAHFEKFFRDLDIKPGKLYIEGDILYHVYDTHQYNNRRKTYNYYLFENICKLYLEAKFPDGSVLPYFAVDESIKQHIDFESVKNWRKGREKFKHNKIRKQIKDEDKHDIIFPETLIDIC